MSRATPHMRSVAARLIAAETKAKHPFDPNSPAAFHVCEKLRPQLATLMGEGGFRAVLSRALAVATQDVPSLVAVRVKPDGSLERWDSPEAQVDAEELKESGVHLVAQLLGLFVAFIGEHLTLRLVSDVWPKLSREDLSLTKRDHP